MKINHIPRNLKSNMIHRFGANGFSLYRFITPPQRGKIMGIIGQNGIGKSTSLRLLAGKIKPNMINWDNNDNNIMDDPYFKGVYDGNISVICKPQYIQYIPSKVKEAATIKKLFKKKDNIKIYKSIINALDLKSIKRRQIKHLSVGQLQRFAVGLCCCHNVDSYLFDTPLSYLDIKQKLNVIKVIGDLLSDKKINYHIFHF